MVPVVGLEPTRIAATDFESVVYTNFTTLALLVVSTLSIELVELTVTSESAGIIRDILVCAIVFLYALMFCYLFAVHLLFIYSVHYC